MQQTFGKLVVLPNAWLGNRIRVISAAYALAKLYNKKLNIIWLNYDQGMNLPFSEIFEEPDDFKVIEFKTKWAWFLFKSASKLVQLLRIKDFINYHFLDLKKMDEGVLKGSDTLIIQTDSRFFKYRDIPLKFKSTIVQEGDRFLSSINGYFIGMHIRRGDNIHSIDNSPTELFFDVAKDEIYKNNRKVLLCTDDQTIKEKFIATFGERIYTRNVVMNKSSAHVIDAAIDMYCLSKSKKIYGSYHSSFSTISAEFNHIPIERITRKMTS